MSAKSFKIVFVTAPNLRVARQLTRAALEAKLVACANLIPKLESHYWWQGKIERGAEVLIVFKSLNSRLKSLEKLILSQHPYETPEFLVLPVAAGNRRYLEWLRDSCLG